MFGLMVPVGSDRVFRGNRRWRSHL